MKSYMHTHRICPRGFTYLGLLFAIVFITLTLALAGQLWSTLDRRSRERQLLFVGSQFRTALANYYAGAPPGTRRQFPANLDDLLRDKRFPDTRRYLRKIFQDPMTGTSEWGLVRSASGEILGVYSKAPGVPLKLSNFAQGLQFDGAKSYAEWIFRAQVGEQANAPVTTAGRQTDTVTGDSRALQRAEGP
jgi:type II secretory pathway pseudopilin PulG